MMDVILITKTGDTSGRNLYHRLTEGGVEVERIFFDTITPHVREKLLKAIIFRFYGDLEELLTKTAIKHYGSGYINDLKLSEFVDLIVESPRLLTAPMVINQNGGLIIGNDKSVTVRDYMEVH